MAAIFELFDNTSDPIARVGDDGGVLFVVQAPTLPIAQVSGGDTSTAAAVASAQIEEFVSEGGGALPIIYGRHVAAGSLLVRKFTAGSPDVLIVMVALGDGEGNGGDHGELDSVEKVWYAGEEQSVSPDGSTNGYRFYRGHISTGIADANQPVDAFLTGGLAYSGTSYFAFRTSGATATEQRPDRLRALIKGRRVFNFDSSGRFTTYEYSANPARVAADRILAFYEHQYPNDNTLARAKFQAAIEWESWITWRDYCDATISWDPGGGAISIARFECHIVFTQDVILADALDQICAATGAQWYHNGKQIGFLPPTERAPVHHFDETNILAMSGVEPRDLRERPNYFIAKFRDLRDSFLGNNSVEVRRSELIKQARLENKVERAFPPMEWSQAQRLLDRQARLESDNPEICALIGDEMSLHVLPGDFVTVSHALTGWDYQRCLVLSATLISAESGVDACEFALQKIEDILYSDFAHGPRQEALTP